MDDSFAGAGIDLRSVPGFPEPNAPGLTGYQGYSPYAQAPFVPVPPVPYRTFGETFSY